MHVKDDNIRQSSQDTNTTVSFSLQERQKELSCIFSVIQILSYPEITLETALRKIAEAVPEGFTSPEKTQVQIHLKGISIIHGASGKIVDSIEEPLDMKNEDEGSLIVGVTEDEMNIDRRFLPEEKQLLKGLAEISSAVIARIETGNHLIEAYHDLQKKNIALREVLFQIESEKRRHYDVLCHFIENRVSSLLEKEMSPSQHREIVRDLKEDLLQLESNEDMERVDQLNILSPREFQICSYIKAGMTNKEIGELLKLSSATVEKHRHSIRKKLNLTNKNVNLSIYLRNNQ